MAMKQANAAQKQWMNDIAEWANNNNLGLLYDYDNGRGIQLHHVMGRSAKQNKTPIGHWFIIPIPFDLHDVGSSHMHNVTHHKHSFTNRFGNQRDLFNDMVNDMRMEMYQLPPTEVLEAIRGTSA
jgi:hypothetical protein|tara:strand:+ start:41 stop:415 length:375 start_codon:yes stop_codon:yes gene_type:complete